MISFKQYFLCEITDSNRNREDLIRSYGLLNHSNPEIAKERASGIIAKWTKLEPLIDPSHDYFGNPPSGKKYNPKDIFSWSRVANDLGDDSMEALQNLEAMLANLQKSRDKKERLKTEANDYKDIYENEFVKIRQPLSEAASCKLGANTHWCISGERGNQWDNYQGMGATIVFILSKLQRERWNKWAVTFYSDGKIDAYDEDDHHMTYEALQSTVFKDHQIPLDILDEFKPDEIEALRNQSYDSMKKISGGLRTREDPRSLLAKLLKSVENISADNYDRLQVLREEEAYPDQAFVMLPLDPTSIRFFTDHRLNPPKSTSHRSMNDLFQESIVQNIIRLSYLTKEAQENPRDEKWVQDMDDQTELFIDLPVEWKKHSAGRSLVDALANYCTNHMSGTWPELEAALLKLWDVNYNASEFSRSDEPTRDTKVWLNMILRLRKGRWDELEEYITSKLKSMAKDWSSAKGHQLQALFEWATSYNQASYLAYNTSGDMAKAFVPENQEQLAALIERGEEYMSSPPHTVRAAQEIR
jgi:hypothetical protein